MNAKTLPKSERTTYWQDVDKTVAELGPIVAKHFDLDDPLGRLTFFLRSAIATARERLEKFNTRLAANPVNAFEWADDAVDAAVKLDVYARFGVSVARRYERNEDPTEIVAGVKRYAHERLIHLAANPTLSTGQVRNLVARSEVAAYAELFDGMRAIFDKVPS